MPLEPAWQMMPRFRAAGLIVLTNDSISEPDPRVSGIGKIGVIHGFHNDREPVIRHVDQGTSRDAPAIGPWVSERFDGCPVGAAGAADPASQDGRTAAPDRHARGDERDLLSAAHGLPLAVFAGRSLSAALDGLQYFPQVPAGRRVGTDVGKKVKGRKLHALVDVEGLPLRVVVHSAG